MKIKCVALILLVFTIFGCNNCKTELKDANNEISVLEKIIEEQNNINYTTRNYCNSTEAVTNASFFHTVDGTATLYFETPVKHELKLDEKLSNKKNLKLFYTCNGDEYSDITETQKIVVEGLNKKKGGRLKVYVKCTFTKDKCNNGNFKLLAEKHKSSIVDGNPFHGEKNN